VATAKPSKLFIFLGFQHARERHHRQFQNSGDQGANRGASGA